MWILLEIWGYYGEGMYNKEVICSVFVYRYVLLFQLDMIYLPPTTYHYYLPSTYLLPTTHHPLPRTTHHHHPPATHTTHTAGQRHSQGEGRGRGAHTQHAPPPHACAHTRVHIHYIYVYAYAYSTRPHSRHTTPCTPPRSCLTAHLRA